MKKFSSLVFIFLILISAGVLFAACDRDFSKDELPAGKYYAESSTDSYVEIIPKQYVRFINIDFSSIQSDLEEEWDFEGCSIAERFGNEAQKYTPMISGDKIVNFFVHIPNTPYALRIAVEGNKFILNDVFEYFKAE